jgi:hydrogenase maturation protease
MDFWMEMERAGPESVNVGGVVLRRGSRVRLKPRARGDVLDLVLAGKEALVEAIDEDDQGALHLSVTLRDDPGRNLGEERYLGHRFFYALDEVEPLIRDGTQEIQPKRVLVAGIGNVFLGDDGFGVEVATQLARRPQRPGVEVIDFGIRGMDLAYALQRDYAAVVLLDAVRRGERPGTLYLIEPELGEKGEVVMDTHGMDPLRVLQLARAMGGVRARVLVVGCEPELVISGDDPDEMRMELSECVRVAAGEAVSLVESLVAELAAPEEMVSGTPNENGGGR